MDKKKTCFAIAAILFFVWLCRPLPEEERKIQFFFSLGFTPAIEEVIEMPKERMGEFLKQVEESKPFQFELAEPQMVAFLLNEKEYVMSPEAGLLLLPDGTIAPLSHERYALGVFVWDDAIYHARAKEKKYIWLPGILTEGTIFVTRYEMEYRRFYPETGDFDVLSEKEYLDIQNLAAGQ